MENYSMDCGILLSQVLGVNPSGIPGCDQTLSPPKDESGMAEPPLSFRSSFGKCVVGRDLRARRFCPNMLAERPEVVPYHTLPEMSAKDEGFGPGFSHQVADKVWSHPESRVRRPKLMFYGNFGKRTSRSAMSPTAARPRMMVGGEISFS